MFNFFQTPILVATIIIGISGLAHSAPAEDVKDEAPSYSLEWEDAQVNLKDLAKQCGTASNIQTTQSNWGDGDESVFRVRCNITLPMDKIQAIHKFPDELVRGETKLQLNYSA